MRDRQGRWYTLRIRPYKDVDNRIDGAVLALFDTDGPKRTEERARAAIELARCAIDGAAQPVALADSELRLVHANAAFGRLTLRGGGDLRNQRLDEVAPASWDLQPLRDLLADGNGTIVRQSVASGPGNAPGNGSTGWAIEARALASYEEPMQRQLLIMAAPQES